MIKNIKNAVIRYTVATVGLVMIAIGVALSIKSDLGTAPVSCPPYVVNLIGGLTVGQYTIIMHFIFILLQLALWRKKFKAEYLMQIAAALVFGFLTDAAISAFSWVSAPTYGVRLLLTVLSIIITAFGVSLEVMSKAWMLAGEMTDAAISDFLNIKFRNAKIGFDIFLVILAATISWSVFGSPFGNGEENVIREGTLLSALFTGLCMKFTDPAAKFLFGRILENKD